MRRNENGFTLIELLVVILIIGILASIAMPAFLGQRNKSRDAAAKSFVRNAAAAMETYWHDDGTYALATVAKLQALEPALRNANGMTLAAPTSLSATGYLIGVTSQSGNTFKITRAVTTSVLSRSCIRIVASGACPVSSKW
jgi:type IV pilus assembly protein PilA